MPFLSVSQNNFKRILGQGSKENFFGIQINTLPITLANIIKSRTSYLIGLQSKTIKAISEIQALISLGTKLVEKLSVTTNVFNYLGLCKGAEYTSEGYDILTNSYFTKKSLGKINLNPLTLTFYIDTSYFIYDIFNYIKEAVLLDKTHGIYEYPDNYILDTIKIATFSPKLYKENQTLEELNITIPTSIKNYNNCIISSLGEIRKDTSTKDSLEQFSITFEYETSDSGNIFDLADLGINLIT